MEFNGFNYNVGDESHSFFCEPKPANSVAGQSIVKDYVLQTDPETKLEVLTPVGESDLYLKIQSHKDSVNIHSILARYNNGDISALNQNALSYFDTTEVPQTLADVHRFVENGRYLFDRLPAEVKEQFGYNFEEFVSEIGTKKFYDALSGKKEADASINPVKPVVEKEVVNAVSEQ